jgi:hypothetical protein
MTASTTPLAAPTPAPEPTHACIRCGRPGLPPEKALCEDCNPLELSQPSATQVHGIAALGILAFVLVLAVLGRWALAGTGPFNGVIAGVSPAAGGLAVSVAVMNEGRTAGATTCRVEQVGNPLGGEFELVQTPLIQPGATAQFTAIVTKLGTTPISLQADCQSP